MFVFIVYTLDLVWKHLSLIVHAKLINPLILVRNYRNVYVHDLQRETLRPPMTQIMLTLNVITFV
jgi:hypothetical protein